MEKSPGLPIRFGLRTLARSEEGMLSLASLFVVLGFLVLIGLLANTGLLTARKVETQNAADSAAYSASLEMARGMNSITAINHMIGELTAVVILIHTLAGDTLDDGSSPPSTPWYLDLELEAWYYAAYGVGLDSLPPIDEAYDEVSNDSQVDGAIWDARMRLKQVLAWAFEVHFIGGVISQGQFIPIIGPIFEGIGDSLEGCALGFEGKVLEEWEVLNGLEYLARFLQPFKQTLRSVVIPGLYYYQTALVYQTPFAANDAVQAVASPNAADTSVYPPWWMLRLPVTTEPEQLSDLNKSQLMRATTPWVQWWRLGWMSWARDAIILSKFADYYEQRSTRYTTEIVRKLKEDSGIHLYILNDLDLEGAGKTQEPWTFADGSSEADQMFTVVGIAHRDAPMRTAPGIFHQENPDGLVCYAQAMFYNANPQQRGSGNSTWQATAGWDTLNWAVQVPELSGSGNNVPQPMIRLNWQAKLVPTTRLTEATLWQTGPARSVLWRSVPFFPLSGAH